jgi:flagellar L-ring protein FlgH
MMRDTTKAAASLPSPLGRGVGGEGTAKRSSAPIAPGIPAAVHDAGDHFDRSAPTARASIVPSPQPLSRGERGSSAATAEAPANDRPLSAADALRLFARSRSQQKRASRIARPRGVTLRQTLASLVIVGFLAGCASAPVKHQPDPNYAPISAASYPQPAAPSNGAIYREGAGGMALFADRRARHPGDLLTITLAERTLAQSRSSTSTSKSTDIGMSGSIAGGAVTLGGRDVLATSIGADRSFDGAGTSDQSNRLEGNLTVTVVDRLPNGNLLVRGEKLLRLNRADEVVQVQGIVRPADIGQDNSIPSSRVGDARIVYTGRGTMAQANAQGWLSRFFNSAVMP